MLKQFRQSLITRLMMYFLIAGFLFVLLFALNIAHGLKVHFKQEILPNIAQYLEYVTQDIGSPPDLQKARQLTENLSFELTIKGTDLNWQSHENTISINQLQLEAGPEPYQKYQTAHYLENNYVLLQHGDYKYLYIIGKPFKGARHTRSLGLIVIIIFSMLMLFFLIRSSLKPLKVIGAGVRNIAEGDLENPIMVKQSTEFNRLANGINDMALQIKSMLEGKQQLLLAISHELRSPLTRAKVNLALLGENAMTQALQDDVNEMEALIGQILESERLNQRHAVLNKSEFYLDQLVEEVISSYFADAGVTCELESLKINADKTRLILLIKNLLDNAIKYTQQGSQPPVIRVYEKNTSIIIEVSDSGCGIEADELDKITQAFYRIDKARQRSTGGFGLGLYLCQLIVSAHHAEMNISSEHQAGTLVKVSFPEKLIPE